MQTGATTLRGNKVPRSARRAPVEARALYWYIAGVVAIVLVLIGVGLYFSRAGDSETAPPDSDNDGKVVSRSPPGYYMRRLDDGRTCRVTVFDQDRGEALSDKITNCEEIPLPGAHQAQRAFSWGAQTESQPVR